MKIAFIGLGNMGTAMARNLVRAGHELTVWNRTLAKTEPLKAEGAKVAQSAGDVARSAEVVITMLADDSAVESAVLHAGGVMESLRRGATHISMSTISVALSKSWPRSMASAVSTTLPLRFLDVPKLPRPGSCLSRPPARKQRLNGASRSWSCLASGCL